MVETFNRFMVSSQDGNVLMLHPPKMGEPFSPQDALLLAAWLVAILFQEDKFSEVLQAVQST